MREMLTNQDVWCKNNYHSEPADEIGLISDQGKANNENKNEFLLKRERSFTAERRVVSSPDRR